MTSRVSRRKVAFIGASFKFVHQAVQDFIICGALENTDCYLYDIDKEALDLEYDLIAKIIKQLKSEITIHKCGSRKEAIQNADYVVTCLLIGGMDIAEEEDKVCRKYNIHHTVGDTVGPMCASRCLRMAPLMVDIAEDMQKYCPDAYLLSPTNPMSVLTGAVLRYTDIKCIGICHGSFFTKAMIAEAYDSDINDVWVNVVGVNHLGFIDKAVIKGANIPIEEVIEHIVPVVRKGYNDPAGFKDRHMLSLELAQRVGFMPNNGDHHFLEFFPWFLSASGFDENGKSKYNIEDLIHDPDKRRKIKNDKKEEIKKWAYDMDKIPGIDKLSGEHIFDIILGLEGREKEMSINNLHLNIMNADSVPNLPENAILELAVDFKDGRIIAEKNPPLDMYRFGVLAPLIAINNLITDAAVKQDKSLFLKALHLDPLISDFYTIPQLADELWDINTPYFTPQK